MKISEDLIRKRAEHNEGEIFSLEELSLHQQDIEKIEYIDKWCKQLKILYLQSNLIPKIENVGRLKNLEYLNLALNNIEVIENLEGCESLKKLDLTVNFVGKLQCSIKNLICLRHLEEMYLTGNPCASYEGYRDFVVSMLPQLKRLDGQEISPSERIAALQNIAFIKDKIAEQELAWEQKRELEKQEAEARRIERSEQTSSEQNVINNESDGVTAYDDVNNADKDPFWKEKVAYTPESRLEVHEFMEKQRKRENRDIEEKQVKSERRFFANDGRPFNINEAKIEFQFDNDETNNRYVLEIHIFKHLDTSQLNCDVQPNYVRITVKDQIFQLSLPEDVCPDRSTAKRSQITGHLVVTMPKFNDHLVAPVITNKKVVTKDNKTRSTVDAFKTNHCDAKLLEIDATKSRGLRLQDLKIDCNLPKYSVSNNIVKNKSSTRDNNPEFVDDTNVPPLE